MENEPSDRLRYLARAPFVPDVEDAGKDDYEERDDDRRAEQDEPDSHG